MNWKTIASEYLTKYTYFTARKDKCITPEGKTVEAYYVVELGLTVCALALTEDGKAILIKQYRHPIEETILEVPGGFVDKNESAETAIARELLEETGYEFSSYEALGKVAANPGVLDNYTMLFLATGGRKIAEQTLDKNEEIEVVLIPLDELVQMLLENKIVQSLHTNCLFYALLKMGKLTIT